MLRSQRSSAGQILRQYLIGSCSSRTLKTRLPVQLKEDIEELGTAGSYVDVAPGFARNYLIPQKKAGYLSKAQRLGFGPGSGKNAERLPAVKQAAATSKSDKRQLSQQQQQLSAVLERLGSSPLSISRRAFGEESLRRPLTAAEVVEAARDQKGVDLSPALLELEQNAIAELGTYSIPLRCFVSEGRKASLGVVITELPPKQSD